MHAHRPARRCRPFRSRLLPDLAGGSRRDGSAAPAVPAGGIPRDRADGLRAGVAVAPQVRRLSGRDEPRVRRARDAPPRRRIRDRQQLRDRRRASRVLPEPEGAGDSGRHRVLVRARRDAPRMPGAAQRRDRSRARRRRDRLSDARIVCRDVRGGHAVARGALQDLRRRGRRLRAGRGRGRARAEAARRRRARSRSDPRRDRRLGPEPGRPHERHHRAERQQPDRVAARRLPPAPDRSGRHRLRRGARHRHEARRSDRADRAVRGVRRLHRPARVLRARLGEDQHRAYVGGGRRREHPQSAAVPRASRAGADAELREPEPPFRFRRFAVLREHRPARVGRRRRRAAPRGRQLVRLQRHQRARRDRGVPPGRRRRAGRVAAARDRAALGAASGAVARLRAQPGRLARAGGRARRAGAARRASRVHDAGRPRRDGRTRRVRRRRPRRTRAAVAPLRRHRRDERRRVRGPRRAARSGVERADARRGVRRGDRRMDAHGQARAAREAVGGRLRSGLGAALRRRAGRRDAAPDRRADLSVRIGALLDRCRTRRARRGPGCGRRFARGRFRLRLRARTRT
ncbi:polyketide synthase PksL domain protein [Burkholderia pseudomallei MSHR5492]|nr:polyketide synthase PksL domain protein [Burkholderia pseudomallei MSHR5492]